MAIYSAVRNFQHVLKGQQFSVIYETSVTRLYFYKHSPPVLRHLDFIKQFSIDRRVSDNTNVVVDALFPVDVSKIGKL